MLVCLVFAGSLILDRHRLRTELIRLHVVANSNSEADQALKLRVRDAVIESLQQSMEDLTDAEQAKAYLTENLPKIKAVTDRVLQEAGCQDTAQVSLMLEEFGTRVYDTFSLPAGVYESLRIVIGDGAGKNWWCVVFPSLCVPATCKNFQDSAVSAGFSDTLAATLEGEEGYELRFFLLDLLGDLENLIHQN